MLSKLRLAITPRKLEIINSMHYDNITTHHTRNTLT